MDQFTVMVRRGGCGSILVVATSILLGQAEGQRHKRQGYYGQGNSTSAILPTLVTEAVSALVESTVTITYGFAPDPTTSSTSSSSPAAKPTVPVITVISASLVTSTTQTATTYAPPPVGPGTGSRSGLTASAGTASSTSNVTFVYEPTTGTAASASITQSANATCGGATLNVLNASLDWWYTRTLAYVVSTLSIQFSPNESQTGWTLLPATTTFDLTSALAQETCVPTDTALNTMYNQTTIGYGCFTVPVPVAAETSLVTIDAVKTINATTGTGTNLPNLITVPPTPSITIPSSAGTFSAGTPFVYFSSYEIMSSRPTQAANGSFECETVTRAFKMSTPFSFEYTGESVDGQLLVGEDVVGDVNPAFLGVVNAPNGVVAGSWVAAPTVVIVIQKTVQAQAALAAHTQSSQSQLQTPSATLPSFLTPVGPTAQPVTIAPSARIESSQTQLQGPTPTTVSNRGNIQSAQTFVAQLGHSETTLLLPTPTDVRSFTTTINGQVLTASAVGDGAAASPNQGPSTTVKPFRAHGESSDIILNVPVPATQTVVTAVADGKTFTATAMQALPSPGGNQGGGNGNVGIGGILSAISAVNKPTNALEVFSQALATANPTVLAIIAGMGGAGSGGAGGSGSGSSSGAQPNRLPGAAPAQVITVAGATVTAAPDGSFQVDGQKLQAGGPAIVVDGTTLSMGPGGTALVVDGSTSAIAAAGNTAAAASIPLLTVGAKTITANAATQYYVAPGQTLTPGGSVVVDGISMSLAADGSYVVMNGQTKALSTPHITPAPAITVGGTVYTPNAGTIYNIGGQILTPGGVITVSGTTISLGSSASYVVINGQTTTLAGSPALNANAAAITAPPMLTVDGQPFAPNAGGSYLISGQILTPGGIITFSGPNGLETVSLDVSGTALVDIISGITTTSLIATAGGVAATAAPVLTIGGQTFTAIQGGAANPTYLIDGQTLTAGEQETVTLGGQTYVISLSPMATVLVIEMVGSGGVITATSLETLFPATNTRGTVYMTATLPGGSVTGTAASQTGSAGATGADAGLQSGSIPLSLQISAVIIAISTLVLAVVL
ncbi:hypothetical protein LTR95_005920 [Oleoguttula sp. CCFEE 5521]